MADLGIVSFIGATEPHSCGYCKSQNGFVSHGMIAHRLTYQNLQDLTDRGWRRCGQYCYLPSNAETCCPLYIIRCEVGKLRLSKSQKKVLKTMNKFLLTGEGRQKTSDGGGGGEGKSESAVGASGTSPSAAPEPRRQKTVRPGVGADPSKPPCRKAKDIRRERKLQKQLTTAADSGKKTSPQAVKEPSKELAKPREDGRKPLESFLQLPSLDKPPAHVLEVKLVQSSPQSPEFKASFRESYELYKKYQVAVHHDTPDKCTEDQFVRFLVDSPLIPKPGPKEWECGYGSHHNQYYIDGKLVMVGVVDILPDCISSVYVYYDPAFSFLTLGVYSALWEISLVRRLQASSPSLIYYCMGYYVHSCQKMRYKGDYTPSSLLCSETHRYIPIEVCRPKLDTCKYTRFDEEPASEDKIDAYLDSTLVLFRQQAMPYALYRQIFGSRHEAFVKEYGALVGRNMATSSLLLLRQQRT